MHFQITKIVLWSRDTGLPPRIVNFEPKMVNVLVGLSRTGKSALIPIIDYCLGAATCAIPKKVVRAACAWFGVVVETSEGEKLFARREPGEQDATEDMFVIEAQVVEVPEVIPAANATARHVKRRLDELSALSNLPFASGEGSDSLDYRPSFRDLMAFVFQPQNVVANPDVLFFRTDQLKHKVKLARNVLPYVLGAISAEGLAAQTEIDRLEKILRRKSRDFEAAQTATSRWESEIEGHLARAAELGLIAPDASLDLKPDAMLDLLRKVAEKTVTDFKSDSSTITRSIEELTLLEAEEARLADDLALLKERQTELSRLREGAGSYQEALQKQRDRLAVSDWLAAQTGGAGCPTCGGSLEGEREKVVILQRQLKEIEGTSAKLDVLPGAVDREVHHLRQGIDEVVEKLASVGRKKRALTGNSEEARQRQFRSLEVARFIGQLQQAIKLYDETHDGGELAEEIAELQRQIAAQTQRLDAAGIARRQQAAVERVGAYIAQFMPQLDNDHPNDPALLVVEDLTLAIETAEGQSFLWSVGSGSNHLSYHIATLLALHCFFLAQSRSSVPGLLILDQPSQVYFPEKVRRRHDVKEDPKWEDEDCRAVRRIFELLGKVVAGHHGKLQVIVLDHAPQEVWGDLTAVTRSEDWRKSGTKLVPNNWPGAQE